MGGNGGSPQKKKIRGTDSLAVNFSLPRW
jgi:hypothetical protein